MRSTGGSFSTGEVFLRRERDKPRESFLRPAIRTAEADGDSSFTAVASTGSTTGSNVSATTLPSFITISRSAKSASSRLCVEKITVFPSEASRRKSFITSSFEWLSSPAVGSSNIITSAFSARIPAIASRLCSPPESSKVRRSPNCSKGIAASFIQRFTVSTSSLPVKPRLRAPKATSSAANGSNKAACAFCWASTGLFFSSASLSDIFPL